MRTIASAILVLCAACSTAAAANEPAAPPDSLHAIDRNRASIVKRIVDDWSLHLANKPGANAPTREALAEALWRLRADQLLAASLAGDADTVLALVAPATSTTAGRDPLTRDAAAKAIGDAAADLVYTPLTPCRIVDTRNAVGALAPNTTRALVGYNATSFAAQGGTPTSCGIPNGLAALAMNVYAVNPTNLGFIKLWASNQSEPAVSTVNYEPPTVAIATGTIVPVNGGANNQFYAKSPAGVHLVVDVVGYMRPVGASGTGLRIWREPTGATVNVANGDASNAIERDCSVPAQCLSSPVIEGAVIAGGGVASSPNKVTDAFGTVSGGRGNRAGNANADGGDAEAATVGGGVTNVASGKYSTVGGGIANTASGDGATIAGGENHEAALLATVGGGLTNKATGEGATVAGGVSNTAGQSGSVGGGTNNAAGYFATIAGGFDNVASGDVSAIAGGRANVASGVYATILGGSFNVASGYSSLAAGRMASTESAGGTPHEGVFVWADSSDITFRSTAPNQFSARATGGVRFVTAIDVAGSPIAGVSLAAGGGSWATISDVAAKADLAAVDVSNVLARVVELPVYTWRYRAEPSSAMHMGPTAQDFRGAFALGDSERTITTVDADGVALAAIQGLNRKLESELESLRARNAALEQALADLAAEVRATRPVARRD